MKQFVKSSLQTIRSKAFNKYRQQKTVKFVTPVAADTRDINNTKSIKERLEFFGINSYVEFVEKLTPLDLVNYKLIAFSEKPANNLLRFKYTHNFNLNFTTNYEDGWEYHRILRLLHEEEVLQNREKAKQKLAQLKTNLSKTFDKAYILGTGPSLEKAINVDWSDGVRIVSNTIVKDAELWNHIQPHFLVAGDAIYHFGISEFAECFRRDLKKRLAETDTHFVFPEIFYPFAQKEFSLFADRLIPIPMGDKKSVYNSIEQSFELPPIGNVLNNLLLPMACYLAYEICLWGFDGRSPNDKLFWKNSDRQFYADKVPQLKKLHPAFFDHLVPANNPSKYVKEVHGDILQDLLKEAESNGKRFRMMHPSYTPVLMERFN